MVCSKEESSTFAPDYAEGAQESESWTGSASR